MSSGPPTWTATDHTAAMNAGLISQFVGLPNLAAFISALGAQLNDVDQAVGQLFTMLNIESATGIQLDNIGATLGQSRNGQSDTNYQTLLQARIVSYQSQGNVEALIQILMTLGAAKAVQAIESQPAAISIVAVGEGNPALTNNDIVTAVFQAKAAGVLLNLNAATLIPAFQFNLAPTANNAGFDQGHLAGPYT